MKKTAKRYTFKQIFIKWLSVSLLVFVILYAGIYAYFGEIIRDLNNSGAQSANSLFTDMIYNSLDARLYSSHPEDPCLKNMMQLAVNTGSFTDESIPQFNMILDGKTYDPLIVPEDAVMFSVYENLKISSAYRADESVSRKISDEAEKYGDEAFASVNAVYISEDYRFIPEQVIFLRYSDKSECGRIDFTGTDTSGFEYTEFEKERQLQIFSGFNSAESTEKISAAADFAGNQIRTREIKAYMNPFRHADFIADRKIKYPGTDLIAVTSIPASSGNNTFHSGSGYGVTAVLFLALALAAAFLEAKAEYAKLKAHYDNEDFRKELTNTMAHDLKTPLMAASGYAENLLNGSNPEKNQHYTEAILENIEHMNSIITDVLELSKLEAGTEIIQKNPVSLLKITNDILSRYQSPVSEKNLRVTVSGTGTVKADESLVKRAAENLISNAVKFSDRSGEITIEISDSAYSVSNSFTGEIKNADELTKPFVKGDASRSSKNGSGLGLSIVRNIAEIHGFKLSVSASDGRFTAKIGFTK